MNKFKCLWCNGMGKRINGYNFMDEPTIWQCFACKGTGKVSCKTVERQIDGYRKQIEIEREQS